MRSARRRAKLLGWANVGNAVVHALLVTAELTDPERYKAFFPDDFETTLPWGPIILGVINGLVGLKTSWAPAASTCRSVGTRLLR